MWPFNRESKGNRDKSRKNAFPEWPDATVFEPISKLELVDAVLRVWLPETCFLAVKAAAEESDITLSEYVREFFVVYLYGALTLRRMRQEKSGIYYAAPPIDYAASTGDFAGMPRGPMYSRTPQTETVPGLGKNIVPLKVFLPGRLKEDFQRAADIAKKPLSTMVRESLIAHFLGNRVLLERYGEWMATDTSAGEVWESGRVESEYIDDDDPIPEGSREVER